MCFICRAFRATAWRSPGSPANWWPRPWPGRPNASMCLHACRIATFPAARRCGAHRWCWRCCIIGCGISCSEAHHETAVNARIALEVLRDGLGADVLHAEIRERLLVELEAAVVGREDQAPGGTQ